MELVLVKVPPDFGGVLLGDLLHLGHDLVALGVGQHHVHAEAGHQADDALGHGEGLAVAGE